jgi:hypothetical protein
MRSGSHYWFCQITLPGWFVALTLGAGGFVLSRKPLRLRRAERDGLCMQCGYDLRGSPERCPECGAIPTLPADRTPCESDAAHPRH